jgi:hypothetical protein
VVLRVQHVGYSCFFTRYNGFFHHAVPFSTSGAASHPFGTFSSAGIAKPNGSIFCCAGHFDTVKIKGEDSDFSFFIIIFVSYLCNCAFNEVRYMKKTYLSPEIEMLEALAMQDMLQVGSGSQLEDVGGSDEVGDDDGWEIL